MQENRNFRIGCVIMAAGNASRFGENKLEARYRGKPLIVHALDAVPSGCFSKVAVITQYAEILHLAEARGFQAICNAHPEYGVSHTILLGTSALRDCDAILYMVADQPLLCADTVSRIAAAWRISPHSIAAASHAGRRGNPCLFPCEFFDELCALHGDTGGTAVIRRHPERLLLVEVAQDELTDVDTAQALHALSEKQK